MPDSTTITPVSELGKVTGKDVTSPCYTARISDTALQFGDWLGDELSRRRKTMRQFSIEIDVHLGTAAQWVDNQRLPDAANCIKVAESLGVDRDFVLELAGHRSDDWKDGIDLSDPLLNFWASHSSDVSDVEKQAIIEVGRVILRNSQRRNTESELGRR